jgi:predicted P-loop ATPase
MTQSGSGASAPLDPQVVLAWAQFYAQKLGWVLQPIHKCMGMDPQTGRLICSCELTGKKWNNCNVEKPGKHPWRGWKQVPMETPEQGYAAFFDVWQQYPHGVNIGIRTGRVSGIWALDLDMGGAKNGVVDIETWMQQQGLTWDDLQTLSAETGGGGYHYVFSYPDAVDKIPTVAPHADFGPSVDVKGDGGYILVHPSNHISGRIYEWREPIDPSLVRPAPDKIVRAVEKKQRSAGSVDLSYTPSLQELKDYGDELARKKSVRAKQVGQNLVAALDGHPIAEDGGAHDAYRDIMYFIAKRWSRADPKEILEHFQDSVAARFAHKVDASTDMANLMDSLYTALEKSREEAESWLGQVSLNDQGRPIATDANLYLYFENHPAWKDVFGYDERRNRPVFLRRPPLQGVNESELEFSTDKTKIALWFQARAQVVGRITKDDIHSAILASSGERKFDPLQQQLLTLDGTWDGVARLQTVLQRCAGTPDTEWVRTVFPLWLKSLVARILWPGCKADTMLILEGEQGHKKSTFFKLLLPDRRFFSDSLSKVSHSIEAIRMIHSGPAVFEIGELSGLRKQEVEEIKAFLSAEQDDLRPLYEPPRKADRRCVFVGTTNRGDYLRDETGGRRFWPVRVGREIDIALVMAEREQWFAEAIARVKTGEKWWLSDARANALAKAEQDERFEEDIWHQPVADWLEKQQVVDPAVPSDATQQMQTELNRERAGIIVTTVQVATYALKLEIKNAKTTEGTRINKILRLLGWAPGRYWVDGKRVRGWKRPRSGHLVDT